MQVWKKSLGLLLLAVVMLFGLGVTAKAEEQTPFLQKSLKAYAIKGETWWFWLRGVTSPKDVTNLKVTNKKIAKAVVEMDDGDVVLKVKVKNYGKTKVSLKAKANGKTYDLSCSMNFKKYTNPFKSIKVGKKNLTSQFKKRSYTTKMKLSSLKAPLKDQKISIKMKKGWKLRNIYLTSYKNDEYQQVSVKNNSKVTIEPGMDIGAVVYNTKTKIAMWMSIY